MMRAAFIAVVVTCSAASAQELAFSPAETETCLASAGDIATGEACIGVSANACMENTPGGYSTVGMSGCLDRERLYWDGRLNAAYQRVRDGARQTDQEMKDLGSSAPSQAEALRDMQRAWIAYRDATCDYERSLWGGGTGGGPATVGCHMTLTGKQALYLEAAQGN